MPVCLTESDGRNLSIMVKEIVQLPLLHYTFIFFQVAVIVQLLVKPEICWLKWLFYCKQKDLEESLTLTLC